MINKNYFKLLCCLIAICIAGSSCKSGKNQILYKNSEASPEVRASDLLARMNLEEKVAQLMCNGIMMIPGEAKSFFGDTIANNGYYLDSALTVKFYENGMGAVRGSYNSGPEYEVKIHNAIQYYLINHTRLGIPAIIHSEGLHGFLSNKATCFPMPLALASAWDTSLFSEIFSVVALEARSRGVQQVLSPVLDVVREPRWGRVAETYGEDPLLSALYSIAIVKAYQGEGKSFLDTNHVIATLKHFPAHGSSVGGHNCAPAIVDNRALRDMQMYPFIRTISEANPVSVMAMYGEIDGEPVHASKYFLRNVLRDELGFQGFVVSDYDGVILLSAGKRLEFYNHQVAIDSVDAARLAVEAGVNIETCVSVCYPSLVSQVKQGKVSESVIDSLVWPILKYKFTLGLFENPYVDGKAALAIANDTSHSNLALKAALESIVMLKNKNNISPIDRSAIKRIAVIGPMAKRMLLGDYSTREPRYFVDVFKGIQQLAGSNIEVVYSEGCSSYPIELMDKDRIDKEKSMLQGAMQIAKEADIVILALGGDLENSKEGFDRYTLGLDGFQEDLVNMLDATGKPLVVALFGGSPYAIPNVYDKADVVYQCWYLGQESGSALASVMFGEYNPSGKLTITIPKSAGHLPVYYNAKPTEYQRQYNFEKTESGYCFPFGYGLSYTSFKISNLNLSAPSVAMPNKVRVTVEISNTGNLAGNEVVQLYIRDKVSTYTRPMKELKAFKKVSLKPGEITTVEFWLGFEQFAYCNNGLERGVESGEFEIMVGNSSEDKDLLKIDLLVEGNQ